MVVKIGKSSRRFQLILARRHPLWVVCKTKESFGLTAGRFRVTGSMGPDNCPVIDRTTNARRRRSRDYRRPSFDLFVMNLCDEFARVFVINCVMNY
jgi:hypothetical protein